MIDKVFSITGNKIVSFITDENALKFSSASPEGVEAFREAFAKKLSLATKVEIKYASIKSVRKEENDKDILISYKTGIGIPGECVFSFNDGADYATFFNFLEKERFFSKRDEALTPFKAIRNYLIGLLATIGLGVFSYKEAIAIANGTVEEAHSSKTRAFNYIVGLLGDKGIIAIVTLISCYLLYKIWGRFSNPPMQIKFYPPNE